MLHSSSPAHRDKHQDAAVYAFLFFHVVPAVQETSSSWDFAHSGTPQLSSRTVQCTDAAGRVCPAVYGAVQIRTLRDQN